MLMFASYMGIKNECWPSYKALTLDCGMSKTTLSKAIKSLVEKNIIFVKKEYKENNRYSFVLSPSYGLKNSSGVHNDAFSSPFQTLSGVHRMDGNNISSNNIINNISEFFKNEEEIKAKADEARSTMRKKLGLKSR
jgi:DNA-binding transcriptional regulator YhcF (GntR family)